MVQMNCVPLVRLGCLAAFVGLLSTGTSWAAVPKEPTTPLDQKEFFRPDLYISTANVPLQDALAQLPNRAAWESLLQRQAGSAKVNAFIDPRSGAASNLIGTFPLLPGDGVGNRVELSHLSRQLGRAVSAVDSDVVAAVVLEFAQDNAEVLGIDPAQLGPVRARPANEQIWHVTIPQAVNGVPVRHGRVAAVISHGNLILIGTEAWGDAKVATAPRLSAEQALDFGFAYAGGRVAEDRILREPSLEIIPFAPAEFQSGEGFAGPIGTGYGHRLAWVFMFQRGADHSEWEMLVDAHNGEVLAMEDKNQYVNKQSSGGVYPLTNTGICPTNETCGVMQLGWPMPWANTGLPAPNNFSNSAGNFDYTSGTATSTLDGRFVRVSDTCGPISLSSPTGDLAFGGANNQHDCTTPGFGGAGNTPASRACFYEVGKIKEQARGWLPGNAWLSQVQVSNVNIQQTCNAFYSTGNGTINFYRTGGGCSNTGEIAAVFDHEWGHAMDDNDTGGVLSNSSEGYADIAGIYRLQASCVGHNFFLPPAGQCGLTLDGTGRNQNEAQTGPLHCDIDCSGVRDADFAKHNPNTPDTPLNFVCGQCNGGGGPCGRQVHCAAAPSRQAAWDLVTRDLTAPPFSLDSQTSFMIGNKIFYQGSGLIGSWHACTCGVSSDGCGATNAYMQWIAADDDNGNLGDGTPHMTALFSAFNRHGIACTTPVVQNGGCAAGPTGSPVLSGTAANNQAVLTWTAVPGATRYWVFRSEGHAGCNFGKALIAEVAGLTYTDNELAILRTYSYNVVAAGASPSCFGPMSNCLQLTPGGIPDYSFSCNPTALTAVQGGSDTSTCTVQSIFGFTGPVALACSGLPADTTCSFNPPIATPLPNGTASSTLTVTVGATTPGGTHDFQANATNGAATRSDDLSITVLIQSAAPTALAVDTAGNRVFQPGETVVMSPSWQNTGTVAIDLEGSTSNFDGPPGAVYTNPDSSASYGTLGLAAEASCTSTGDCYTVHVDAAVRPVTHWDSTILETVTPGGDTKEWTLHIGDSFTDVTDASGFYRFIETILHKNVTGGCTPTEYCPAASTSREQMAVFVLVSKEAPGYAPPNCVAGSEEFADVPATSPFCRWVEELYHRGVVGGCGNDNYCPASSATREQMAVFVLRTLDPTLTPVTCITGAEMFADVPATSPFCKWIEELARRGVVTGCGGGNYCPAADVRREEMAVFLTATFGLALYGL